MIDWSKLSECTVYCRCDTVFRAKHKINYETHRGEIDRPCPGCGKTDDIRRASHDPERLTIRG